MINALVSPVGKLAKNRSYCPRYRSPLIPAANVTVKLNNIFDVISRSTASATTTPCSPPLAEAANREIETIDAIGGIGALREKLRLVFSFLARSLCTPGWMHAELSVIFSQRIAGAMNREGIG
jgi:hypothetical protein